MIEDPLRQRGIAGRGRGCHKQVLHQAGNLLRGDYNIPDNHPHEAAKGDSEPRGNAHNGTISSDGLADCRHQYAAGEDLWAYGVCLYFSS